MAGKEPNGTPPAGVSRRTFIKGTTTVVSSLALSQALSACDDANHVEGLEPLERVDLPAPDTSLDIILEVNGEPYSLTVEPRVTLAEALRDSIGLTGTKIGCDRAACGACTVIMGGRTALACSTLAVEAEGMDIQTIEGLASGAVLHPVQAAFARNDALQCGFCTAGMVMSVKSLLDQSSRPSLQAVKNGVAGNICRCGTYPKVFQAALEAAEELD